MIKMSTIGWSARWVVALNIIIIIIINEIYIAQVRKSQRN